MNNKGFAISSVLYLLLVSFMMFLMVTLNQFQASSNIISKSNEDLTDGTKLYAQQIYMDSSLWYSSNLIVQINNPYGKSLYWPRDFYEYESYNIGEKLLNDKINVLCSTSYDGEYGSCRGINLSTLSCNSIDNSVLHLKIFLNDDVDDYIIKTLYCIN